MNLVTIIVVAALCAIGVGLYLRQSKKGSTGSESVENINQKSKDSEPTSEQKNALAVDHLVNLNINLRVKTKDKEIISETESIIDELIEVVQVVNETGNYSEHTPLINRMATNYLPNLFKSYIDLPEEDQKRQADQFKEGLVTLKNTIHKAKTNLEDQDNVEFVKQMGFVKAFFEDDFNGGKA